MTNVGWRQVRVTKARLDALSARAYLAADEREDAESGSGGLPADELSGGHLHLGLRAR
jgi:hypothetical protein